MMFEEFQRDPDLSSMMPRHASLSDSCTPDRVSDSTIANMQPILLMEITQTGIFFNRNPRGIIGVQLRAPETP